MKAKEDLKKALSYVKKGWTQGAGARDINGKEVFSVSKEACSWCMIGALFKAQDSNPVGTPAYNTLCKVLPSKYKDEQWSRVAAANDDPKTTKEQVIKWFKEAIKLCK